MTRKFFISSAKLVSWDARAFPFLNKNLTKFSMLTFSLVLGTVGSATLFSVKLKWELFFYLAGVWPGLKFGVTFHEKNIDSEVSFTYGSMISLSRVSGHIL